MASMESKRGYEIPDRGPIIVRRGIYLTLAATLAAAFLIVTYRGVFAPPTKASSSAFQSTTLSSPSKDALMVTADNKYTLRDGKPFLEYYPWLSSAQVLEPFRESTISVVNPEDGASYDWNIDGQLYTNVNELKYTCEEPGTMSVQVTERVSNDKEYSNRIYESIWYCKYIRREIRGLFDEDREAFFEAAEVLYKVPETAGVAKFGANYLSMDKLVFMHNNLAGHIDCDHAHDGKGFVTTHIALSNVFERSLQSVNPSVTLPYWDYTIEGSRVFENGMDLAHWFNSEVFRDDWFGEANPPNHVVTRGRFAYTRVRSVSRDDEVHNVYGFVRAPWNANKSPYVTRCNTMLGYKFDSVPSCAEHLSILSKTSWKDFADKVAFGPHALIHALLGGMWGADWPSMFADFNYSDDYGFEIAQQGFSLQKQLWRAGFFVCPTSCAIDDDVDLCKCTCPALSSIKDDQQAIEGLLANIQIFRESEYFYNMDGEWVGYDILRVVCNDFPGVVSILGDQLESASPADISFWPIHPTLERLLQWKKLNGGFEDDTWLNDHSCQGHNPDDEVPFIHVVNGQSRYFTNTELLDLLDPRYDNLDYIYDKFEWDHCEVMDIPSHLIY